jgi:hypothetical protein
MDVDTSISTSGELTEAGVLTGEFRPTELEEIVEVIVSTKVVDGSLTVEVVISTSGGVLAESGVITGEFGPTADVERIVEVIVSVNVVDGSITVERVVWVATVKMQLMVPDWLKSIPLASPEPPVIMAFVQVGDI